MKFCYVCLPLKSFGGAERLICEEATFLVAHGHDLELISRAFDPEVTEEYGLSDAIRLQEFGGYTPVDRTLDLREKIVAAEPDVVHVHYAEKSTYLASQSVLQDVPLLAHVHGSVLWFHDKSDRVAHRRHPEYESLVDAVPGHSEFFDPDQVRLSMKAKADLYEYLRKRALRDCDTVFTGSNIVKREVDTLYGVDAKVVHPGVPNDWIANYRQVDEIKLSDSEYDILYLGRLDERKRVELLIRSFAGLLDRRDDVSLIIGGSGPEEGRLRTLVQQLGLQERVNMVGHVREDELASHYKSANVFATPGWMSYGIVPLEAYSMRTKVAISVDAFAHEVLGDCPGVRVVEPNPSDWTDTLDHLIDLEEPEYRVDRIPTWTSYCKDKFETLDIPL